MTIDTSVPVRRSGNTRGAVDIVEDDATFVLKRAIFTKKSCCTLPQGCRRRGRGGGGGGIWKLGANVRMADAGVKTAERPPPTQKVLLCFCCDKAEPN
jgi:hypothetical protein